MIAGEPDFVAYGLALILGAILGSFIATILLRWPHGRSIVTGPSRCVTCGDLLRARDLVPILSYLKLRGKCRVCGGPIDRRHLAVELAAAIIGLVAIAAHPFPLALVTGLFGIWLLLIATLDRDHLWLPDHLTLPLIPLGLAAAWAGLGPSLESRAIGAAVGWAGLSLIAIVYRRLRGREGLGGGDPKLLAAIGAWVGLLNLPFILLGAGLLGLAAILMMRLRGQAVSATTRLPLGTLMAISAWPVWLLTSQSQAIALF